jgi:NAD(P)-dependent dehydrogenase (short-subunit alcohol dehydrogenase family)
VRFFYLAKKPSRNGRQRGGVLLIPGLDATFVVRLDAKTIPELPVRRAKTAIVTGASSGIGLELAKKLSLNGYRVVANSRRITSARTLTETEHIKLVDGDISLPETAERVVATAIQHFGTIDLLVNNAGVFLPKPFTEYTTEDLRVAVATNLFGFFFVSQLAVARCVFRNSDTSSTSPRRW